MTRAQWIFHYHEVMSNPIRKSESENRISEFKVFNSWTKSIIELLTLITLSGDPERLKFASSELDKLKAEKEGKPQISLSDQELLDEVAKHTPKEIFFNNSNKKSKYILPKFKKKRKEKIEKKESNKPKQNLGIKKIKK